ncbi:MAG: efflux RND transporter periplasmic adaptor subunit [Acidobacteriota bacterium]
MLCWFSLNKSNFRVITTIILAVIAIVSLACRSTESSAKNKTDPSTNTTVTAVKVATTSAIVKSVPSFLQVTGTFLPYESSDIAPEISGQIAATPVDVGSYVKQGDIIMRLADQDARLRLEQAQAAENQALAALRQAKAKLGLEVGEKFDPHQIPEVQAALAAYESAQAQAKLAETNANRYANLIESGDISRSVYDQARTQAETAQAQAKAAHRQYEAALNVAKQSNQGVASAQAAYEGAHVQLAIAQKALNDTVIRAPFAGFISDRPAAVGEYVTPASKLITLQITSLLKLSLQVPEVDASHLALAQPVEISVTAYPERKFQGKVTIISPTADPTARVIYAVVGLTNPDNLLYPGMFATAHIIEPASKESVFVPVEAVTTDQNTNSTFVYVIENNVARLRVIQPGVKENGWIEVLSGVSRDEVVATSNVAQLYDGVAVTP